MCPNPRGSRLPGQKNKTKTHFYVEKRKGKGARNFLIGHLCSTTNKTFKKKARQS